MPEKTQSRLTRRLALGGLATALATPHVARAAVRSVRIGFNSTDDSLFGLGAIALAKAVAEDPVLADVLKIELFGTSQLGDDVTMLKNCAKGTLDGMLIGTSILSNVVPEVGIINAPYLFSSALPARQVLDGAMGVEFSALAAAKGVPVLAWGENGIRHITSSKPVRTVEDLKGLKIRVPQSEIMLNGFLALGAAAAPLPFNLLPAALRTGEFQAQENAVVTIETSKLYEVQKYLCLTGHIYDGLAFVASSDLLEDLTEPQRKSFTACAQKGAIVTRRASDTATTGGIARLRAVGMTVIEDVDVAGLRAAARPFNEGLKGKYGAARVSALLATGT